MRSAFLRAITTTVTTALLVAGVATQANAHPGGDNRARYTNACTLSPDQIPKLIYLQDLCNRHDVWYARYDDGHHEFGSNEWGRYLADYYFLQAMVNRCFANYSWWDPRRGLCVTAAWNYFYAVRAAGAWWYYDNNTRW